MRVVCRLGREVLDECARVIAPGVTTTEIDRVCHEATIARNCYPSPLNYIEFPRVRFLSLSGSCVENQTFFVNKIAL